MVCACVAGLALAGVLEAPAFASHAGTRSQLFGVQSWTHPSTAEFQRMDQGGVGTFRSTFDWWRIQPGSSKNWDFRGPDALMAQTASFGITLLPNIVGTPKWAGVSSSGYPPTTRAGRQAFAAFLRRMVARYGPKARFKQAWPKLPFKAIRYWQVWNEPSFPSYWTNRKPNAREYVSLLKLARKAIKSQDPGAKIILGGLPNSKHGVPITTFLRQVYEVPGARDAFGAVAIHPYAQNAASVEKVIERTRAVMSQYGDETKGLWLTEIGWASGGPKEHVLVKDPQGQATAMRNAYAMIARRATEFRIGIVAWFSWRDRRLNERERDWWAPHTGLFTTAGAPKPAWDAFTGLTHGDPGSGNLSR